MPDIKYEIIKKIGVLSKSSSGWAKELNLISWNDRDAYDGHPRRSFRSYLRNDWDMCDPASVTTFSCMNW